MLSLCLIGFPLSTLTSFHCPLTWIWAQAKWSFCIANRCKCEYVVVFLFLCRPCHFVWCEFTEKPPCREFFSLSELYKNVQSVVCTALKLANKTKTKHFCCTELKGSKDRKNGENVKLFYLHILFAYIKMLWFEAGWKSAGISEKS